MHNCCKFISGNRQDSHQFHEVSPNRAGLENSLRRWNLPIKRRSKVELQSENGHILKRLFFGGTNHQHKLRTLVNSPYKLILLGKYYEMRILLYLLWSSKKIGLDRKDFL